MMAVPGQYTVTLSRQVDGEVTVLAGPETFEVVPLGEGALEGASPAEMTAFRQQLESLQMEVSATSAIMEESQKRVQAMQTALERTSVEPGKLDAQLYQLKQSLLDLQEEMYGNPAKEEIGESNPPTIQSRLSVASRGMRSTYGLTPTHVKSMEIAREQLKGIKSELEMIHTQAIPKMESALKAAGAPWIEGQSLPKY